jgi:rhodanese-related sulfurtransferase
MPKEVGRADVRRLADRGASLVEVLPAAEYEAEHIDGAINIPLDELDASRVAPLERGRPIVAYCNDDK